MDMPSNQVFSILAYLFAVGMPVWTMAQKYEDKIMGKIAKKIPFAFIPFIILQIVCIALRINQYGLTYSRYICIVIIILESIYFVLYFAGLLKKTSKVHYLFIISAIIMIVIMWMPKFNIFNSVAESLSKRLVILTTGYNKAETTENKKETIYNTYINLSDIPVYGHKYITDNWGTTKYEWMIAYNNIHNSDQEYNIKLYANELKDLDISKYKYIYRIDSYNDNIENDNAIYTGNIHDIVVKFNLNDLYKQCLQLAIDLEKAEDDTKSAKKDEFINSINIYEVNDQFDIYFEYIYMRYNKTTNEKKNFEIRGYLLEK